MKLFWAFSLLLLLFNPGLFAQTGEVIDWDYEIDLLARELSEKHPNLFFRTDSTWFYHAMHQIARETHDKSLFQVSIQLQQVLAVMGDAQTKINYHFLVEKSKILPFEFYWFEDGIYVLKADKAYEALLGKKLTAINDVPIEEVTDSLATLLVLDNQSVLKNQIPRMLVWFQVLEYFGFASGNELSLTVLSASKGDALSRTIDLPVELGEMLAVQPATLPLGWQDRKSFFREQYFENEHLYYIQYNRCWSREAEEDYGSGASALFMPSFKEFEKEVFPVLKKKEINKLVFDIRFNKGGHASQGTEFIRKICKTLPKDHGDIFVLVGRVTNASAIINTVDFMKSEKVVLVGEETSGKPNHFGEVNRFVLPESKLIVSYSTRYFTLLDEDLPTLMPDVLTPLDFDQYMNGIDPAMEAVILTPLP
jgi:hypothetical protein